VNEDARTKIRIYDTATGKLIALPAFPEGDITSVNISRSEKLMTFYFNGSRSPSNLYVYDFATKKVRKLTESLNPEIDPADLVESKVIRTVVDGRIPSICTNPSGECYEEGAMPRFDGRRQ
jgi:dipeptidyl aminopeptidase/acylaminoacyl peptidase